MKKLRLITKGLLFLSFFLPFIMLPECSWNNAAVREKQIIDSLTRDSIMQDSLMKVSLDKEGQLQHYYDSIKNERDSTKKEKILEVATINNNDTINNRGDSMINSTSINVDFDFDFDAKNNQESLSSYLSNLLSFLIFPTERSVSGFGASLLFLYLPIEAFGSLGLGKVISISLPFSFLLILGTIIYLFFKPNLKRQFCLSIGSLIFISTYGILVREYLLWGFFIALLLNLVDVITIYWSIRKEIAQDPLSKVL